MLIFNVLNETNPPLSEIYVRHMTVDEALPLVHKQLYDAFMAGACEVRVVHGKGTGKLRELIRKEMDSHPLVESYREGGKGEGGDGVTIVELSER